MVHLEMETSEGADDDQEYDGLLPKISMTGSASTRKNRKAFTITTFLAMALFLIFGMTKSMRSFDKELATSEANDWQDTPEPVQVFLLAGQSNMVGFGSVQHLQSLVQAGNYTHLMEHDGNWIVRPRVRVVLPSMEHFHGEALTVGQGYNRSFIGPELGFGWTISERLPKQNILLIKAAWDGYSLAVNFRPPSAGIANYTNFRHKQLGEEKYGTAYRQMMSIVNETLHTLSVPYELKGFVWFQGWADQSPQKSGEYTSNLIHLIQDIRSAWNVPDLRVVIGECGQYRGKQKDKELLQRVRDAQKAVTDVFPNTSQLVDARAFTHEDRTENYNPGFHYHGHADTYYDIGAAFGNAMLDLLAV